MKIYGYLSKVQYLGSLGILRLARDILISSLYVKKGAIVRWPFYIRKLGKLEIGRGARTGPGLVIDIIERNSILKIGDNFKAGSRLHIGCLKSVTIKENVLIASDVYISDHSHGQYNEIISDDPNSIVNNRILSQEDIVINENVWIGEKVCILPGAEIGRNSIVGAGSVVNSKIPANSIVAGVPAKVIKMFDDNKRQWVRQNA
ncbi:hypothetical protein [Limnohabitans sp.]|uniref:hypothetical protein n=1 Tax=Limnohabitans sp. TaxID=1907725 RepID=UPI0038B82B0E